MSPLIRRSTGTSDESEARRVVTEIEARYQRTAILGPQAALTFADAILLYDPDPKTAQFLLKIIPEIGPVLLSEISPERVRSLGPKLYPDAATDTWARQVLTPVRAVMNKAHEMGQGPAIRIRGYSAAERLAQDKRRGKTSRREVRAGDWTWIDAFQKEATPALGALAEFMFETGARIGQAVALTPEDLDLARRRVWLPASKAHLAQWVSISDEMAETLAELKPRRPRPRRLGDPEDIPSRRVFGYAKSQSVFKPWKAAAARAGIEDLTPHEVGRKGFFTELAVRQGVDLATAAKAGRWANVSLPAKIYAAQELEDRVARTMIRTKRTQGDPKRAAKVFNNNVKRK